jgi:myo-inositol-1(or 4)-monophosphatase
MDSDLLLIRQAARDAGELALSYFGNDPQVWYKNGTSPVCDGDIEVNRFLERRLRQARPDYGWLSEETADDKMRLGDRSVFVVDPIDGTRAFIRGDDIWCVSIAVVCEGKPVAGVLACPARQEFFEAQHDGAALNNGTPIQVAPDLEGGGIAAPKSLFRQLAESRFAALTHVTNVPSLAYRLAMVADGRLSATLVRPNANDWDLAAAHLILQRAGGDLVDMDGRTPAYNRDVTSHGILVAAAEDVLPELRAPLLDSGS